MALADVTTRPDFFVTGIMLQPDAPSYVERLADDEILQCALARKFCYVLAPPHLGKSSLMVRTGRRLREQGMATALIYLSGTGDRADLEQWYQGLIVRLAVQLELAVNPAQWWKQHDSVKAPERFVAFLHDAVLAGIKGPVVIFVDEIETVPEKILTNFLAAIRSVYNARANDPVYNRLTFVILGMAEPDDLIKDGRHSPFTIGQRISLNDFTRQEADILRLGLAAFYPEHAEAIFSRIFYWTHGHPYLCQKLCQLLVDTSDRQWTEDRILDWVDRLVETTFLLPAVAQAEPHLKRVGDYIEGDPHRNSLMAFYKRIFAGQDVPFTGQSPEQRRLILSGLVRTENDRLKVRNEIYRRVFNLEWLKQQKGINWLRPVIIGLVVIVFFFAGFFGLAFYRQQQQANAEQAQGSIASFRNAANPQEQLTRLAALFMVPGYEPQARRLFFEELSPAERLALFQGENPRQVQEPLVTVIRGVYIAPNLAHEPESTPLLEAMVQLLRQLDYSSPSGVVELELEITQWLKGRTFLAEGDDRQAMEAYDYAISLNGRNPGTYFDRALIYQERGEFKQALADLTTVATLNKEWQPLVKQVLTGDGQMYDTLWQTGEYQALAMLIPSPTPSPTPTATATPSPSPTPSPTRTPVPPSPTATATAVPTARPTVVAALEPTVTLTPTEASVSAADLVLLSPLSLESPSFGPTTFEWQWREQVPDGYGFEVRVWRQDEQPSGVHNAVLDNQSGNVKSMGKGKYSLSVNIRDAAGIKGRSGEYLWTVALVQISPKYADLGEQADPARLRFEAGGSSSGGGGNGKSGGGGGGGGVGID